MIKLEDRPFNDADRSWSITPDDPMGHAPADHAAALADLGLTSDEIARYYGVEEARVRRLLKQNRF